MPDTIKALSLWQPWASLVALGAKRIETRHWGTRYRGPLAIHAAKRWTREELSKTSLFRYRVPSLPEAPPLGAVVGVVNLVDCVQMTAAWIESVDEDEERFGHYAIARWGWMLEDARALASPVPLRGRQGLFSVPLTVLPMQARQLVEVLR